MRPLERGTACHGGGREAAGGGGAEGGTRTPMALRPLAPEASASANSATSACAGRTSEYNLPPMLDSRGRGDSTSAARTPLDFLADVDLRHRDRAIRVRGRVVFGMELLVAESSATRAPGAVGNARRARLFRSQAGREP